MTRKRRKRVGARLIQLLEQDPDSWRVTAFTINRGDLQIWTENRPYADICIWSGGQNGPRLGTWWQRRKIRRLIDEIGFKRGLDALTPSREEFHGVNAVRAVEAATMDGVDELLWKVRLGR